ncbi:MAG TPA: PASTA domain-containing protein [Gemmatimonadales bacterium]|jgi:serine/threonine-protein kinase|nr:PASTA domain-containing protein [Gemmatimonadales bacterium]
MRFRRSGQATREGLPYFRTMAGRRLLRQAGIVVLAFVLGYLFSVFWLFPAPLFSRDRSVPRVIGDGVNEARRRLEAQGFRPRVDEEQADPTAPRGEVIWQDPPPLTVAPPNTQVSLIVSAGPSEVGVPDVVGFPGPLAERVLRAGGFRLGRADTVPSVLEPGVVVGTRPPAGTGRPAGTPIDLVISSGPAELTVPGLVGLTVQQARERLEQAGLRLGEVTARTAPGRPAGTVIEQRPGGGTRAARGTRVDIILSRKVS